MRFQLPIEVGMVSPPIQISQEMPVPLEIKESVEYVQEETAEERKIPQEAAVPEMLAQKPAEVSPEEHIEVSMSPSLENELLLQELALLMELGEDAGVFLTNEELIREMEMIEDIGTT